MKPKKTGRPPNRSYGRRSKLDRMGAPYLEYVVSVASATERNYVSDIEKIAALAYDNAQEAGRPLPTLMDIKDAISDVLPAVTRTTSPPEPAPDASKRPLEQARCTRLATRVQRHGRQSRPIPQSHHF